MSENPRPFLLQVTMVLGGVFGSGGTLVGVWALQQLLMAEGPFLVEDVSMSKAAFLRLALPLVVVYISACITAGAAAFYLWKHRARSRLLLLALLCEFVVGDSIMLFAMHRTLGVSLGDVAAAAGGFVLLVAVALWYLFRRDSVVDYYRALSRSADE